MRYFSTKDVEKINPLTFFEALKKGQAEDRGLFVPESFPKISKRELESLKNLSYSEIVTLVLSKFIDEIPREEILSMANDAYDFEIPIENISENKYIVRLDQGPTASFKDFAARMMARFFEKLLKQTKEKALILAATSGDTGSAVASAYSNVKNVKVAIIFPEKEVSEIQRKQMTTIGAPVYPIAVRGTFDDCQALVKQAFQDHALDYLNLASANSINIGRLLPQICYYFYAWSRVVKSTDEKVVFVVPSGNFGNVTACLYSKKMGLPIKKIFSATNSNDSVPRFLNKKEYKPIVPSVNSISNAMNVGHPSNLPRIINLYDGVMTEKGEITKTPNYKELLSDFDSAPVTDKETTETIKKVFILNKTIIEPHGAVGYFVADKIGKEYENEKILVLETAHPSKFGEIVGNILGVKPELQKNLKSILDKKEKFEICESSYEEVKRILRSI